MLYQSLWTCVFVPTSYNLLTMCNSTLRNEQVYIEWGGPGMGYEKNDSLFFYESIDKVWYLICFICVMTCRCILAWRSCHSSYLPTVCWNPNIDSSSSMFVQFQRILLNWYWHSFNPILAPSPLATMASGRLLQMALCLGASPGILLHMMLAPRATTDERAL